MRPHALNRVIASLHFRNDGVVIVGIKPSAIPNLSTRLPIERRVVKNNLSLFASLEFLHALPDVNDRQKLAAVGSRVSIPLKLRLGQLLIGGIRRLLGSPLPGRSCASLLLVHRPIKARLVKDDS